MFSYACLSHKDEQEPHIGHSSGQNGCMAQGNPLRGRELRLERVNTAGAPPTGVAS